MNAKELFKKRVDEVNELATTYNVMQARFEVLEAENSQLKGDIDTLSNKNQLLIGTNENLEAYCDSLENHFMAPDSKTIDNVTIGSFKRLMHDILNEHDECFEPLVRPIADSKPPVGPAKETDGQSDSRTAAKEQAA